MVHVSEAAWFFPQLEHEPGNKGPGTFFFFCLSLFGLRLGDAERIHGLSACAGRSAVLGLGSIDKGVTGHIGDWVTALTIVP